MNFLPGNLICTVGTSLFFPNLKFLIPEKYLAGLNKDDPLSQADREALSREGVQDTSRLKGILEQLKSATESQQYGKVASLLLGLPADVRLCGAEINSIEAMIRKKFLPENRHHLVLLTSDTPDGDAIGEILFRYFSNAKCRIGFKSCHVTPVPGLQDKNPLRFQREGLLNLIRLIGEHYRKWTGAIAINATGGYKAQIALAVAFGQATGSPVYYKHERFNQIIRFPRVPFSLDLSMFKQNLKLWADLAEPNAAVAVDDIRSLFDNDSEFYDTVSPLLESIDENNSNFYSLSPLGMVYWEAFRSLNPDIRLKPRTVTTRKGCRFRDDHYPKGFREHVKRFYNDFPDFVSECHSLPYSGQKAIYNRFYVKKMKDKIRIIGEYKDRNNFGARFEIMTRAENILEAEWVVRKFNDWLEK